MKRPVSPIRAMTAGQGTTTSHLQTEPAHGTDTPRCSRRTASSPVKLLTLLKLIVINLDLRKSSVGAAIADLTARRIDRSAHFFKHINDPSADVIAPEHGSTTSVPMSRIAELATAPWPTSQCGPIRKMIGRLLDCVDGSIDSIKAGYGNQFEPQSGGKVTAIEVGSWLVDLRELLINFSDGLDRPIPFDAEVPAKVNAVAGRLGWAVQVLELSEDIKPSKSGRKPVDRTVMPEDRKKRQMEWLAKAMLMVRDHPEWSDATIAKQVGMSGATLSRSVPYQRAAHEARKFRGPRGTAAVAGGVMDIEAEDDSLNLNRRASKQFDLEEATDDRIDREINERNAQRNAQRNAHRGKGQ